MQQIAEENKDYPALANLKFIMLNNGYGNYEDYDLIKENLENKELLNAFVVNYIKEIKNYTLEEDDDFIFLFRLLKEFNKIKEMLEFVNYRASAKILLGIVDDVFVKEKDKLLKQLMTRLISVSYYGNIASKKDEVELLDWIISKYDQSDLEVFRKNRYLKSTFVLDKLGFN